jgi:hypothetical protein
MLAVAATAKEFSIRPSELLDIGDAVVALGFDMAAAVRCQKAAADEEPGVNRIDW